MLGFMGLVLITLALLAPATATKKVSGKVMLHTPRCGTGGAALRPEDMAQHPAPRPIGGREIFVQRGESIRAGKPDARFVSREDGTFTVRLVPGTWCFFDARRAIVAPTKSAKVGNPGAPGDAPPITAGSSGSFDPACLARLPVACDVRIEVTSDTTNLDIGFLDGRCPEPWSQSCYIGPIPS
jgi:hypothetical protein